MSNSIFAGIGGRAPGTAVTVGRDGSVERESRRKIRRLGVHFPYDFFG